MIILRAKSGRNRDSAGMKSSELPQSLQLKASADAVIACQGKGDERARMKMTGCSETPEGAVELWEQARAGLGARPGARRVKITDLTTQHCFNRNVSHDCTGI